MPATEQGVSFVKTWGFAPESTRKLPGAAFFSTKFRGNHKNPAGRIIIKLYKKWRRRIRKRQKNPAGQRPKPGAIEQIALTGPDTWEKTRMIKATDNLKKVMQTCEEVSQANNLYDGVGLECPGVAAFYEWFDANAPGETIGDFIAAAKSAPSQVAYWIMTNAVIYQPFRALFASDVINEYIDVCILDVESRAKIAATFPSGLPKETAAALNSGFTAPMLDAWRGDPEIAPLIRTF